MPADACYTREMKISKWESCWNLGRSQWGRRWGDGLEAARCIELVPGEWTWLVWGPGAGSGATLSGTTSSSDEAKKAADTALKSLGVCL